MGLIDDQPAAVGGADEVDLVEAQRVEGLVHPLRRALGLPHRFALDAPAGVTGSVESVNGALGAEGKGVGIPLGGAASRTVYQDHGRT